MIRRPPRSTRTDTLFPYTTLFRSLQAHGVTNADDIARSVAAALPPFFDENDLRDAFRSGWHQRNRNPGLKRQAKKNVHNAIMSSIGGARHLEQEYVPDKRTYHNSIWAKRDFRKPLKNAEAHTPSPAAYPH